MTISRAFSFAKLIRNSKQIQRFFEIADTAGTIDSFAVGSYPAAHYIVTAENNNQTHTTEILVQHNGTTVSMNEYGTLYSNGVLATYDVTIISGVVRLRGTPTNSNTDFKFKVQYVEA
jgi:hypothetical protein